MGHLVGGGSCQTAAAHGASPPASEPPSGGTVAAKLKTNLLPIDDAVSSGREALRWFETLDHADPGQPCSGFSGGWGVSGLKEPI